MTGGKAAPLEFDCVDCGSHVFRYGWPSSSQRCGTCQWLADMPDPAEREKARAFLDKKEEL
jgi:hypothetical protein